MTTRLGSSLIRPDSTSMKQRSLNRIQHRDLNHRRLKVLSYRKSKSHYRGRRLRRRRRRWSTSLRQKTRTLAAKTVSCNFPHFFFGLFNLRRVKTRYRRTLIMMTTIIVMMVSASVNFWWSNLVGRSLKCKLQLKRRKCKLRKGGLKKESTFIIHNYIPFIRSNCDTVVKSYHFAKKANRMNHNDDYVHTSYCNLNANTIDVCDKSICNSRPMLMHHHDHDHDHDHYRLNETADIIRTISFGSFYHTLLIRRKNMTQILLSIMAIIFCHFSSTNATATTTAADRRIVRRHVVDTIVLTPPAGRLANQFNLHNYWTRYSDDDNNRKNILRKSRQHQQQQQQQQQQSSQSSSREKIRVVFKDRIAEDMPIGRDLVEYSGIYQIRNTVAQNMTFKIRHDSDIDRRFDIGQYDGILRVAKPLDRETKSEYRLVIEARDSAGNTGNTSAIVVVNDVNDNAPEIIIDPSVIIVQESANFQQRKLLAKILPFDRDESKNGPPFHLSLAINTSNPDRFQIEYDKNLNQGKGGAYLYFKGGHGSNLDREGLQGKILYVDVLVKDSGKPSMEAVRRIPVIIGDVNDNPMANGRSTIFVYNYNGLLATTSIGRVFVEDLDDWDFNDKTFELMPVSKDNQAFFTVSKHGMIQMAAKTPPGAYELQFLVVDRSKENPQETAVGTVTVNVNYLDGEAVQNSGSFILKGLSPEDFLRSPRNPVDSMSPYENFKTNLAHIFNVKLQNVHIFSVQNATTVATILEPACEVHFSIKRNSPYEKSWALNGILSSKQQDFERLFNGQFIKINIDPCLEESCSEGGCTRRLVISREPSLVFSNRSSLVGLQVKVDKDCVYPVLNLPEKCTLKTCLNNGICHNVQSEQNIVGFFCECREVGRGSRCEVKTRSFKDNGYVWLKSIGSYDNFTISFEFLTKSSDAVLLYNGPMASFDSSNNGRGFRLDQSSRDFLLIELVNGLLTVHVDLGSGSTTLQMNNTNAPRLNDSSWHTVDIFMQKDVRTLNVVVDRCRFSADFANYHESSSFLDKKRDRSFSNNRQCKISAPTNGPNEQLNVDTPLQLGGLMKIWNADKFLLSKRSLIGCMRNLQVNGELYDLLDVARSENSQPGCQYTEDRCGIRQTPYGGDDATKSSDDDDDMYSVSSTIDGQTVDLAGSYCHQGECLANMDDYNNLFGYRDQPRCECDPGFYGKRCEKETRWKLFKSNSLIQYRVLEPLSSGFMSTRVIFIRNDNRLSEGTLIRAEHKNRTRNSALNILDKQVGYELGSNVKEYDYSVRTLQHLHPKTPYMVELNRFADRYTTVVVDGLHGDYRSSARRLPDYWMPSNVDGQQPATNVIENLTYEQNGLYLGSGAISNNNDEKIDEGCIRDFVFNDLQIAVGSDNDVARVEESRNVDNGCPLLPSCASLECPNGMVCQEFWKGPFCTCPVASQKWTLLSDGTLESCQPVAEALRLGITDGAVAAMLASLIVIILLTLLFLLYSRQRRKPPSIQEDLISRENVRGYNEEGGGEEDQDNYNIGPLRKPVLPGEDWPDKSMPPLGMAYPPPETDLDSFIRQRMREMERDPGGPYDELRPYGQEGDPYRLDPSLSPVPGSEAESIDENFDPHHTTSNWGPKFQQLADIYGQD